MRKIFIFLLICCIFQMSASAQKPVAGEHGFTVGISGLQDLRFNDNFSSIGTILFRHYIKDNMALRVGLNLQMYKNTQKQGDTILTQTNITKTNTWNILLGVQKSFQSGPNLEPYVAADLMFGGGKTNYTDNKTEFSNGNYTQVVTDPGGSFMFGIEGVVGFNLFLSDHFALGGEFGYTIHSINAKESETKTTTKIGPAVTTTSTKGPDSKTFEMTPYANGTITLSVFFKL